MNSEKVVDYIVNWLKSYAENTGVKGFVVGVSGGVDSAVTSTLCAKTGLKTICVEMPIHQNQQQVSRAEEHISQLCMNYSNVSCVRTDLTATFENFKEVFPRSDDKSLTELTLANTRARIRMTTLYYIAGTHSCLVAGTGNKVEDFGVGFYTKYGDGGVDLSPIADLLKSEVFSLAKVLEVPDSIQTAAPTDGLFGDSRTDEDQIGASYAELEWAMDIYEKGKSSADFVDREREVFKIYSCLNKLNQHKMQPIPVCEISNDLKK